MKSIVFLVRRQYYDAFARGEKTFEVRRASKWWLSRARYTRTKDVFVRAGERVEAVIVHPRMPTLRFALLSVSIHENAEQALGRPPSKQGRGDLGRGRVLRFNFGGRSS